MVFSIVGISVLYVSILEIRKTIVLKTIEFWKELIHGLVMI